MRVGLLIYGSLDTISGGYLYDRKLVEFLRQAGDSVELVNLPWRDYARHLSDNISPALLRHLEALPVDILLQDELNHPSLFLLNRRLRQKVSYPVVSIVHHLRSIEGHAPVINGLYRRIERLYLRSVDGFIYNSQTTRKVVLQERCIPAPGVVAYPAGDRLSTRGDLTRVDPNYITRRALEPGPLRLLFLGNVIWRKGLHVLLEALQALPKEDWHLTVAGRLDVDPGYTRSIRQQIDQLALRARVLLTGPLDETELVAHLTHHQVLVVPSFYEGFGIAYLEGMGFGLPAIASAAGAASEIITDGQNGYLIPPGDTDALAERLSTLACQRDLLADLSLEAFNRYQSHPTWQASMETARQFLCDLLEDQ